MAVAIGVNLTNTGNKYNKSIKYTLKRYTALKIENRAYSVTVYRVTKQNRVI